MARPTRGWDVVKQPDRARDLTDLIETKRHLIDALGGKVSLVNPADRVDLADRALILQRHADLPSTMPSRWVWALSGGGAKGSFQVGASIALSRDLRYRPEGFSGTSVGSVNALGMAHGLLDGVERLKRMWFALFDRSHVYSWSDWVNDIDSIPELADLGLSIKGLLEGFAGSSTGMVDTFDFPVDEVELSFIGAGAAGLGPAIAPFFPFALPVIGKWGENQINGIIGAINQAMSILMNESDGVFTFDPLAELIDDSLDTDLVQAAALPLRFTVVNLSDGHRYLIDQDGGVKVVEYSLETFESSRRVVGRSSLGYRDMLVLSALASACVPVVNPPVEYGVIRSSGLASLQLVDGGVREVLPVEGALDIIEELSDPDEVGVIALSAGPVAPIAEVSLIAETDRPASTSGLMSVALRALGLAMDEVAATDRELLVRRHSNVLEISPAFELGGLTQVDPGLIQIGTCYGYMTAFDRLQQLDLRMPMAQYWAQETQLWFATNLIAQLRYRVWQLEHRVATYSLGGVTHDEAVLADVRSMKRAIAVATLARIARWGLHSVPGPTDISAVGNVNCVTDWWRLFELHKPFAPLFPDGPGWDFHPANVPARAFARETTPWMRDPSDGAPSTAIEREPDYCAVRIEGHILAPRELVTEGMIPLYTRFSPERGDNFTTSDQRYGPGNAVLDYRDATLIGYVFDPQRPQPVGTLPLYSFWSRDWTDNLATTDISFTTDGWAPRGQVGHYRHGGLIGYVSDVQLTAPPGTVPLCRWFSRTRRDNYTTSHPSWQVVLTGPLVR